MPSPAFFFFLTLFLNICCFPLKSRCTKFRFAPLSPDQMRLQLDRVVASENLNITADGYDALIKLSTGDMRKALNVLQSTSMGFSSIDERTVYLCTSEKASAPLDGRNARGNPAQDL